MLMGLAVASALAVIYFTYLVYRKNNVLPVAKEEQLKPWQRVIYNKYYVDEFYDLIIRKPVDGISKVFYKVLDIGVIDGIVNATGSAVRTIGISVRYLQTGNIGLYIMGMVLGIVCIFLLTFLI
jgi:NADH-quinone oxidoreductase subunit L